MLDSLFIGYVGEADFHDGSVLTVERQDETARIRVRGASGKVFVVDFSGVQDMRAKRPEGMLLYAVSAFAGRPPLRRFVFANWDDDNEAYLEVDAESFAVRAE